MFVGTRAVCLSMQVQTWKPVLQSVYLLLSVSEVKYNVGHLTVPRQVFDFTLILATPT